MGSRQSWFSEMAFGQTAGAPVVVRYESHEEAIRAARQALGDSRGLGLIMGSADSGKSTIARELADKLSMDAEVALVSGIRQNAHELLSEILTQFGYGTEADSADELLKTIGIFAVRQLRVHRAPVVIIDDADRLYPSALRCLNALAELRVQNQVAVRMLLVGQDGLRSIIDAPGLEHLAQRVAGEYRLQAMSLQETMAYLHQRLEACGIRPPDSVFPVNICDHLHARSGGWPGLVNRQALEALDRADDFPVTAADIGVDEMPELPVLKPERVPETDVTDMYVAPELSSQAADPDDARAADSEETVADEGPTAPRLVLTRDGRIIQTYTFNSRKVLLGRSELADIVVSDGYVSKIHALFLLYSDALVLLDLNSSNGLTVNSRVVKSTILRTDDIIVLGHHRLKVENAPVVTEEVANILQSGDTVKMKNLITERRRKARLKAVKH